MTDYSPYAQTSRPQASGTSAHQQAPPPLQHRTPHAMLTDHAGLAGQFGSLSMANNSGTDPTRLRGPRGPLDPPPFLDAPTPTQGSASSARSPSHPAFPPSSSSAPGAPAPYSAANRPRPQLSPVLTSAPPPRGYQLRDGASPASYEHSSGATGGAGPRVPRKSSLPALHDSFAQGGAYAQQQQQPPLPPLPPSGSSSAPLSHQASLGGAQRDSSGGEQVFDGASLSAGRGEGAAQPSRSTSSATAATAAAGRRSNPLADLIATETAYVEDLGVIIKRVAAAWSRANFPPPVLDAMFRAVEAVYRVNKGLLAKLLEIGPSPSSPKALGDLLMRWIDEIEPAYTRYAATLQSGYDTHAPVQSNPRLAPILASLPWPSTLPLLSDDPAAAPAPAPGPTVTLDALFALPVTRVGYYQRLYAKLLRSTQEGRSDHALLVSANDKLRRLAAQCDDARARRLDDKGEETTLPLARAPAGPVVRQGSGQGLNEAPGRGNAARVPPRLELDLGGPPLPSSSASARAPHGSDGSGAGLDSPSGSSSYRSSGATGASTANTSATQSGVYAAAAAAAPPPLRVEDLEHRLDPSRALDIFTMQPRKCKLQMQPPSLAFKRQLRKTGPVALSFVPSSDPSGRQVRIPRAHLVLLTDLFLVCAPVEPADEHAASPGADYWLLYPPLAGKHLRVRDADSQGEFEVAIMGKERLTFRAVGDAGAGLGAGAEEQQAREWRAALDEATRFGAAQGSRQNSGASAGGGASPISPTYRSSPLSPSFQASVQASTAPNSAAPSPHLAAPVPALASVPNGGTYGPHAPPSPVPSAHSSSSAHRPQLQLQPPGTLAQPPSRAYSSSSSNGAAPVPRPERNASMLSSGSHPAPPSSLSHTGAGGGAYTGGAFVQSPTGSAFPHSPVGTGPGSSRGASPYPGSESSAYGRQSPYGQQQQQQQQQAPFSSSHAQDFTPPPPLQQQQQGQGQYGHPSSAYPMPRSPHSAHDFSSSSRPSSSRPSSRQSNGSYASSQAYPEFDPRAAAPPPLPKERSYNGVDISGRGGPLYATSLQGSAGPPSSRTGSGMLAPHSSSQQQVHRSRSADGLRSPPPPSHAPGQGHAHGGAGGFGSQYRMPSQTLLEDRSASAPGTSRSSAGGAGIGRGFGLDFSPPASPTEERGPAQQHRPDDKTSVVAQMRCKIFLQQHHSVWKSLGTGKLKLFYSLPSGTKQLVVDSDKGGGKTVISTIVLTDGVERVGKTGVAIELSDQGDRTGIVYMLQMKTEQSATGLFEQLLLGTDRAKR